MDLERYARTGVWTSLVDGSRRVEIIGESVLFGDVEGGGL